MAKDSKKAAPTIEEVKSLVQEFFDSYPEANSVLVVGTNLFLSHQMGAAKAHALNIGGIDVQEVHRNQNDFDNSNPAKEVESVK